MNKIQLQKKIDNTIELFSNLNQLHWYKEDTNGNTSVIYNDTLELLNSNTYNTILQQTVDSDGNNLLHLAANNNNVTFFLLAAKKGINPYIKNNKNLNSFHSKNWDFSTNLWKKLNRIYFECDTNDLCDNSFIQVTEGFHPLFKQTIYEKNIAFNSNQLKLSELTNFLKITELFSNKNVLLFLKEKITLQPSEILKFLLATTDLTPEENSLGLLITLRSCLMNQPNANDLSLLENWINCNTFKINDHFIMSLITPASKYKYYKYKSVFNQLTSMLVQEKYDINKKLEFYYAYAEENKTVSFKNVSKMYTHFKLTSVYNYYKLNEKIANTEPNKSKPLKI